MGGIRDTTGGLQAAVPACLRPRRGAWSLLGGALAAGCLCGCFDSAAPRAVEPPRPAFERSAAATAATGGSRRAATLPLRQDLGAVSVLIFTRSDCPIANRYAPEIARLSAEFAARGVRFHLVYPDRRETAASMQAHLEEYALRCDGLLDPDHALAGAAGATVTPEAVVFNRAGERVYRGRIDDRFVDYGKARRAPTTHDLQDVLEACLGDRPVEQSFTRAVGCLISDLR
jgi:hypothetical protein